MSEPREAIVRYFQEKHGFPYEKPEPVPDSELPLDGRTRKLSRKEFDRLYREREAYLDKELRPMPTTPEPEDDEQDEPSVVMFDFEIGDKVWMADAQDGPAGRVVRLIVDPGETMYVVTWSDTRCTTTHYAFELSKEKPVSL